MHVQVIETQEAVTLVRKYLDELKLTRRVSVVWRNVGCRCAAADVMVHWSTASLRKAG